MEVLEAARSRRSVRRYEARAIPEEFLRQLEESLLCAPSAGNLQSRRFQFVFREDVKGRLAEAALGQDFINEAPLAIVCCADKRIARHYGERGLTLYCIQDVAASVQNLMLVATALGLGTVWVGAFDEDAVSRILGLPPYLRPVAIVPVGFPGESPPPPERGTGEPAIAHVR